MDAVRRKVMVVAIVVALLSLVAVGAMSMPVAAKNTEINMIAQVNQNGSAIVFIKTANETEYYHFENNQVKFTENETKKWDGQVIGTPGVSTIQHTMMKELVETQMKNAEFIQIGSSGTAGKVHVFFQPNVSNYDYWKSNVKDTPNFLGCIIWEYVVSQIVEKDGGKRVITSENIDPGHSCCVIAANNQYLKDNTDATIRFLKSYVKGVKEVQDKCKNGTVDPEFLTWASKYTGQSEEITKSALLHVTYTYGNGDVDPLGDLRQDVSDFVMSQSGMMDKLKSQGYNSADEFANELVDDTPLNKALAKAETDISNRTIKLTVIKGDIHQIALHWANQQNYFADNYIKIEVTEGNNGSAVATSLQNGEANLGFMGVPPITSTIANSKLNPSVFYELTGRAVDANGNPLANVEVTFLPSNNQEYTVKTDSNGNFTIKVIKGTYTATEGYNFIVKDEDAWSKKIDRITDNVNIGDVKVK